jgi:hypothetical protein
VQGNEKERDRDRDVFGEEKYTLKSENDTICQTKFECYNDTMTHFVGWREYSGRAIENIIYPLINLFNCVQ